MPKPIPPEVKQRFKKLGRLIEEKFAEWREINGRKLSRTPLAGILKVDRTTANRLKSNPWRIRNLTGEQVWKYLDYTGFTAVEIKAIIREYSLNSPSWMATDGDDVGQVRIMKDGSVTEDAAPTAEMVPGAYLMGRPPDSVRLREVAGGDLVSKAAEKVVAVGDLLIVAEDVEPGENDLVIVSQGGARALIVWPLAKVDFAFPIDPTEDVEAVRLYPETLKVFQVVINHGKRRGLLRGKP